MMFKIFIVEFSKGDWKKMEIIRGNSLFSKNKINKWINEIKAKERKRTFNSLEEVDLVWSLKY